MIVCVSGAVLSVPMEVYMYLVCVYEATFVKSLELDFLNINIDIKMILISLDIKIVYFKSLFTNTS